MTAAPPPAAPLHAPEPEPEAAVPQAGPVPRPRRGRAALYAAIGVFALVAAVGTAVLIVGRDPEPTPPTAGAAAPTAEQQAEDTLGQIVRDQEAAINAAYLDPTLDPTAALKPYLAVDGLESTAKHVTDFRASGAVAQQRTAAVESVTVTDLRLDWLDAYPGHPKASTATVQACTATTGTGLPKEGPAESFSTKEMVTVTITTVSVLTPPQRSDTQPPKMRSAAAMNAASMVN